MTCTRCGCTSFGGGHGAARYCIGCYEIVSDLDMDLATIEVAAPETPDELRDRHEARVRRQASDFLLTRTDRFVGPDQPRTALDPRDVEIARLTALLAARGGAG